MAKLVKDLLRHFILEDTFCNHSRTTKSFKKKLCDLDVKDPLGPKGLFTKTSLY